MAFNAALISAADDGDLEAVERYFTLPDALENVAVYNAIHRCRRLGEPSPMDGMDGIDPWYSSNWRDVFGTNIVPRGHVDVFRWFFARGQRELLEETLRARASGIAHACIDNGALSTAREMLEIFFESLLFNETMSEEERSELLAFLMKSAVDYRHHKSLQLLLAYGADPYYAQGLEAPLTAIGNVQDSKTLEVLLAHGAWMQGCQLSLSSTRYGDEKLVGDLLRSGADANVEQPNERSVLHRVVGQHRYCSAQLLIEEGFADVDARDNRGRTPLMLAASVVIRRFGPPPSQKIAKLLLDAGADLHAVDNYRRGVLHCTVSNKQPGASHQAVGGWNPDCLRLFLERGANPNLEDDRGRTPLTTLVIHARYNIYGSIKEMLKLLLQAGADPFIRDNRGHSVAELLQRSETGLAFMQENPVFFAQRDALAYSEH
jgi:hypothetical protein